MSHDVDVPATIDLIYEHTRSGASRQTATSDANDAKAFQVFGAATVLLGFGSFGASHNVIAASLYCGAAVAYVVAGFTVWRIVAARGFRVIDAADRWWPSHRAAPIDYVRSQMLDDMATAAAFNRAVLRSKAAELSRLLPAVAVEALLVAAAVISRLA